MIGSTFDLDVLHALLPAAESGHLAHLISAELIDQIQFLPEARYAFRHPLVRAVAYESQLTTTRAEGHRRLAAAIETRNPSAADENSAFDRAPSRGGRRTCRVLHVVYAVSRLADAPRHQRCPRLLGAGPRDCR